MSLKYIAIDQYGRPYLLHTKHPGKELLDRLNYKSCDKMYVDGPNNAAIHIGYVIGELWLTVYKVERITGIR